MCNLKHSCYYEINTAETKLFTLYVSLDQAHSDITLHVLVSNQSCEYYQYSRLLII